jgi:hypothetical protein
VQQERREGEPRTAVYGSHAPMQRIIGDGLDAHSVRCAKESPGVIWRPRAAGTTLLPSASNSARRSVTRFSGRQSTVPGTEESGSQADCRPGMGQKNAVRARWANSWSCMRDERRPNMRLSVRLRLLAQSQEAPQEGDGRIQAH